MIDHIGDSTSLESTTMDIEVDRRHAFYFDTDGNIHPISPNRLDRIWRGEPDAGMPELAGQRVRFAVLHIERFSKPPHIVVDHYPLLTFDANGRVDLHAHHQQIQADVDHLEATGYAPMLEPRESESTWHPDLVTRRRLLAATNPIYAPSRSRPPRRHDGPATIRGRSPQSPTVSPTLPTRLHRRSSTRPTLVPSRR
jgi:hypothetical protein